MSTLLSTALTNRRGGLLAIAVGIHATFFFCLQAVKTARPTVVEPPLIVDLLAAQPLATSPQNHPPVVTKPLPKRPKPAAAIPPPARLPALDTTDSKENAPVSAPVVAPPAPLSVTGAEGKPAASGPSGQGETQDALSKARFDADYLHNPAPPYPPQARRMGEEGKVILRVEVSAEGRAQNVEIKTSSGSARLDESALRTVRNWRFVPAKRGETAVDSWVLVPIIFKLEH